MISLNNPYPPLDAARGRRCVSVSIDDYATMTDDDDDDGCGGDDDGDRRFADRWEATG